MFKNQVDTYIQRHQLLSHEGLHLVALSGGADSVALLRVLLDLDYSVEAMHCNFHLRGEESNRDEEFCRMLCSQLCVPLHIVHFDTKEYASLHHVSIEMAARNLRYSYFRQLLDDLSAESICVAHHKDDCAETMLMNLVRGTGINGLTGIRPRNGRIIRPLLCVTRAEIEDYLTLLHQTFISDSSNLVADVTRNKIRLNIMPQLRDINPSVNESMAATAQHVAEALPFLQDSIIRWKGECLSQNDDLSAIDLDKLNTSPSPRYLLFAILSDAGFPSALCSEIADNIDAQTGRLWETDNMIAAIDRGRIIFGHRQPHFKEMRLPIEGNYNLPNGHLLKVESLNVNDLHDIDRSPWVAQMDASKVNFPLTLREVRQGDRFTPFGMRGSKLVSDFLTDRKLNIIQKQRQLCLCDAYGEIIWLPGQRISNKKSIGPDTIKVLRARYIL